MPKKFTFHATEDDSGKRVDHFLVENLKVDDVNISRSYIHSLLKDNQITHQKTSDPITNRAYKVKNGDHFSVIIPDPKPTEILPREIDFDIIFEDDHMLVVNKPASLTTHPGNGNQQNTLVNALLFYLGDNLSSINGIMRPGIVHRLDKDTSGLMVVAKNDIAHASLSKQIAERTLKRKYLAFCYGVPHPVSGVIDKNIGRSKINRLKMTTMKSGGRHAVTNYNVKEIYQDKQLGLIEFQLQTGRTHQIRVHATSIGHSIIGDQVYGGRKKSLSNIDDETKRFIGNFPRQALHSYFIHFTHPVNSEAMEFTIDLPDDMRELKRVLKNSAK